MRLGRLQHALGLLVTVALLGACDVAVAQGSVHMYTRNASANSLGMQFDFAGGSEGWSRIEDGSRGCYGGGVPWTISFGAAGREGAIGDYRKLLASTDVPDPTNAVIWIDVAEDGSVSWGQGRPEWDREPPFECT